METTTTSTPPSLTKQIIIPMVKQFKEFGDDERI